MSLMFGSCREVSMVLLGLPRQIFVIDPRVGYDHFRPHPFRIITHQLSYHSRVFTWVTASVVKLPTKKFCIGRNPLNSKVKHFPVIIICLQCVIFYYFIYFSVLFAKKKKKETLNVARNEINVKFCSREPLGSQHYCTCQAHSTLHLQRRETIKLKTTCWLFGCFSITKGIGKLLPLAGCM